RPPTPTLFPYTTLFRSRKGHDAEGAHLAPRGRGRRRALSEGGEEDGRRRAQRARHAHEACVRSGARRGVRVAGPAWHGQHLGRRSEEHTSELQSLAYLV